MRFFHKNKKTAELISGPLLISQFETAINNIATAETAKYVAEKTEQETMDAINSSVAHNSVYVTPEDLSPEAQAQLLRSSVNAHLQKAQSLQINNFANQQVAEMQIQTNQLYKGKKVKAINIAGKSTPFESVWQDSRTGEVNQGQIKSKTVSGIIEEINFEKNALILTPSMKDKLLVPDRKFIIVYVLDPDSLKPAVDLII